MIKRLSHLLVAALLVVPMVACDEDGSPVAEIQGTISGFVTIDGQAASGVTVNLTGAATDNTVTAGDGSYSFSDLGAGSYVVSVSAPAGVVFPTPSQGADLSAQTPNRSLPTFAGQTITTSQIVVNVLANGLPVPNVTVDISGPADRQQVTDATGQTTFTALPAGTYTIDISNLPGNVTIADTSEERTVGVGGSQVVTFSGTADVTASVAIESIVTVPGGTQVNPAAVAGVIDVGLSVDEGQDDVEAVRVFLGDSLVFEQLFSSAEEGLEAAVFNPHAIINTALFNTATGEVAHPNQVTPLEVQVETALGGVTAATISQNLTLTNTDFLGVIAQPEKQAFDGGGLIWNGGNQVFTVIPVIYSTDPNARPASVTVTLSNANEGDFGPGCTTPLGVADCTGIETTFRTSTTANGAGHFVLTFSATSGSMDEVNTGPDGSGVTTTWITLGGQVGAPATTFAFNELQSGTSQPNGVLRIDLEDPTLPTISVGAHPVGAIGAPASGDGAAFVRNGWVNETYVVSSSSTGGNDNPDGADGDGPGIGVGLASPANTFFVGASSASCSNLPGTSGPTGATVLTILGAGNPLLQTDQNTDVELFIRTMDKLMNSSCASVLAGVDETDPEVDETGTWTDNTVYNPPVGDTYDLEVTDSGNGFSGVAGLRIRLHRMANGGVIASTITWDQEANAVAAPLDNTISSPPPQTGGGEADGYKTATGEGWDRAGNMDTDNSVDEFIIDGEAPDVVGLVPPLGPFSTGQNVTIGAGRIDDNVDLRLVQAGFYLDATLLGEPNTSATTFIPLFETDPVTPFGSSQIINEINNFTATLALIDNWELVAGDQTAGDIADPDGVNDIATTGPAGAGNPTLGVGVAAYDHSAADDDPTIGFDIETDVFPDPIPTGFTSHSALGVNEVGFLDVGGDWDFVVQGNTGTFAQPYAPGSVMFFYTVTGFGGQYFFAGTATGVSVSDFGLANDGRRFVYSAPSLPAEAAEVFVVVVNGSGDALITDLPTG